MKTDLLKARCAEYYLREVEGVMDVFTEKLLEARDQEGEVEDILHQTRQTVHTKKGEGEEHPFPGYRGTGQTSPNSHRVLFLLNRYCDEGRV